MTKKLILLVEDDPDDVALTLRVLRNHHVANEVVVVNDGAAALDYLFARNTYADRDAGVLPAVVLLDLKLPKLNGLEVLERIRAEQRMKYLPVVILTSSKEEQDLMAGYAQGCNSYVRKPVDFGEFAQAVGQLSIYWLLLNETPPCGERGP